MKEKMNYATVFVFSTAYRSGKSLFTYTCPRTCHAGDLVLVPFGKRTVRGLIMEISTSRDTTRTFVIKSIHSTLTAKALTKNQLALAEYLSREYFTSLGSSLKRFLPPTPPKKGIQRPIPSYKISSPCTKIQRQCVARLTKDTKNAVFEVCDATERNFILSHAFSKKRIPQKTLILFPDVASLKEAIPFFDPLTTLFFHGSLTPNQRYHVYQKVKGDDFSILLGTHSTLFLPYNHLTNIVIIDEFRDSYKQYHSHPRYSAVHVCFELLRLFNSKCIFVSSALSTRTRTLIKKQRWRHVYHNHTPLPSPMPIDIRLLRYNSNRKPRGKSKNAVIISPELKHAIQSTLSKRQSFLLLCDRRGLSSLTVCKQCHEVLRCPSCQKTLIAQADDTYLCIHCAISYDMFLSCATCSGMEFTHRLFGTQAVEQAVREIFPSATLLRVDPDTPHSPQKKKSSPDILIATPRAIRQPILRQLGGIGIIEADSFWGWPEYYSEERAFLLFHELLVKAVGASFFIIQTYRKDHQIMQALSSLQKRDVFLKRLSQEYQSLHYPPYSRLITIECQKSTKKQTSDLSTSLVARLREVIPPKQGIVSDPFLPLGKTSNKRFFQKILIRIHQRWYDPLPPSLIQCLTPYSRDTLIDVDPISISS